MGTRDAPYGTLEGVDLTPRQREVLELIAGGYTNPQIGERLGISLDGAKWHVSEVLARLGVDSREQAAEVWREHHRLHRRAARAFAAVAGSRLFQLGAGTAGAVAVIFVAIILTMSGSEDEPIESGSPTPQRTSTAGGPGSSTVVYARESNPREGPAGRRIIDLEIRAADTATGTTLASTSIEGALGAPATPELRGNRVYVNHPDAIRWYALDGSDAGDVVSAPTGRQFAAFAIDSSEERIAYWLASANDAETLDLVITNVATGERLATVDGSAMDALPVFGQQLRWSRDSESLLARVASSHSGQLYEVTLDGDVAAVELGVGFSLAPDTRTAFYSVSAFSAGCPEVDPKGDPHAYTRAIRDLSTGEDHWRVETDRLAWEAYPSPDGARYLFAEYECERPNEDQPRELRWATVSIADPDPKPVTDPLEVLRDWYGDELATGLCDGETIPPELGFGGTMTVRTAGLFAACDTVSLEVGGDVLAEGEAFHVLGTYEIGTAEQ